MACQLFKQARSVYTNPRLTKAFANLSTRPVDKFLCPRLADSVLMSPYLALTYRAGLIAMRNNDFIANLSKDFELCANHSYI